jgi:kumamolisin
MFWKQHLVALDSKKASAFDEKNVLTFTVVLEDETKAQDVHEIVHFAKVNHLNIVTIDHPLKHVKLSGTVAQINKAFAIAIKSYEEKGKTFYGHLEELKLPDTLRPLVQNVIGLSNHQVARPYLKKSSKKIDPASHPGYTPPQVAGLYDFPAATGKGQSIAVIELGGGYYNTDLQNYFSTIGVPLPNVVSVSVDGATNSPSTTVDGADIEVALDIEVSGGIAPGANIVVYFAPNTDQGFYDAIVAVIKDTTFKPKIISISWGAPENEWGTSGLQSLNSALLAAKNQGITTFVASGDQGYTDGESTANVDFPSSSAHASATGGTSIQSQNGKITSEVVWNDNSSSSATGGGFSNVLPLPQWQSELKLPASLNVNHKIGRAVPDVAALGDPDTGYSVLVNNEWILVGGTSAAAPCWAGLIARLNTLLPKNVGFLNPTLYTLPSTAFRDITQGNNGGYYAGPGYDLCSGNGSPNGPGLLAALKAKAAAADSTK